MSSVKETRPITQVVTHGLVDQVKQAEIKIAAFTVEHNLPLHVMDHLSARVLNTFPDSRIALEFWPRSQAPLEREYVLQGEPGTFST